MIAPSLDIADWLSVVEQMEVHVREREVWFFAMPSFSPDEVEAATEVLTGRLGWCPRIYGAADRDKIPFNRSPSPEVDQ